MKPKKLVVFEGAGHVDLFSYDATKYETEIISYLDQVLNNHAEDGNDH
ncbi:MAG: hypothetical protein AAF939_15850 [Planctomycetota bacterium]